MAKVWRSLIWRLTLSFAVICGYSLPSLLQCLVDLYLIFTKNVKNEINYSNYVLLSSLIIFTIQNYKENNEPLKEYIDDAYFKENLSHCWDHDQPYLTFEKEFTWDQGSVMYCDMSRYHASNNYRSNGIDKKTCITLMMKKKIA